MMDNKNPLEHGLKTVLKFSFPVLSTAEELPGIYPEALVGISSGSRMSEHFH